MKRKFSNSQELHEFIFFQLQSIVGVGVNVTNKATIFDYRIYPHETDKCLWGPTLRRLIVFLTEYSFHYYIDFELGYLRVYTYEDEQKKLGRL